MLLHVFLINRRKIRYISFGRFSDHCPRFQVKAGDVFLSESSLEEAGFSSSNESARLM